MFTVGPEEGKVYQSKKGYPCKADRSIDSVTAKVSLCLMKNSEYDFIVLHLMLMN